jgi:hypothetical protein
MHDLIEGVLEHIQSIAIPHEHLELLNSFLRGSPALHLQFPLDLFQQTAEMLPQGDAGLLLNFHLDCDIRYSHGFEVEVECSFIGDLLQYLDILLIVLL